MDENSYESPQTELDAPVDVPTFGKGFWSAAVYGAKAGVVAMAFFELWVLWFGSEPVRHAHPLGVPCVVLAAIMAIAWLIELLRRSAPFSSNLQ